MIYITWGVEAQARWIKRSFLFLCLSCSLFHLYSNIFFLPGIKYHLGHVSLSDYYDKMGFPFLSIASSKPLQELKSTGAIALFCESPHLIQHPQSLPVSYYSKSFDPHANFKYQDFKRCFIDHQIEHVLLEADVRSVGNKFHISNMFPLTILRVSRDDWANFFEEGIKEGFFEVLDDSSYHLLLRIP